MSITLRIILIVCSILSFVLVIRKIKQTKLKISDCIIWILESILLIFMSLFSNFVTWISAKLGFVAPVNFVFFIMIVFLLIELFSYNMRISLLNEKVKNLNHYIALKENEENEENKENNKNNKKEDNE